MDLIQGNRYHGFHLTRVRQLEDCDGTLYEFVHKQTGAELCWLKRNDTNKTFAITFKTIPENDTGVFHILEHSVLNGSKKYPVREPFVELLKSSLQTFLNAFTYPDKTMYPISSRNDHDFMNLMSVYLDAVFHPAIYTNPNIFYQEGWHYEIRDPKDDPIYKGVVLNEMKGAFSSVDETIVDELNRMVFTDNCYQYVSGGDPKSITDLSYEKFIETHSKFYHPSNARVFLDGSLNIDTVLAFINDEYFCEYEKEDMNFVIPKQKMNPGMMRRCEYEINEEDDPKEKTQIAFAKIVSDFDDVEKNTAWNALNGVLVSSNESKLKKAIIDNGLGQDVELDLFDGIQQPWMILTIRNTDEEKFDTIRDTIRKTILEMVEEGLNHNQIIATLNRMEFKYREKHEPAGLMYGQRAMDAWLYEGDPATYLSIGSIFETLRQKTEEGYFEELLKEFFLDEEHMMKLVVVPSKEYGKKNLAEEKQKLQNAKASWGNDIEKYIAMNAELDEWQKTPDTKEQLDTLPKLKLSEIDTLPQDYPWQEKTIQGVPCLVYPEEKTGIVYMNLYFSLAGITRDHLASAGFFSSLLTNLPTRNKTVEQLQEEMRRDLGSLSFFMDCFTPRKEYESCIPVLGVSCSALTKNADRMVPLILEVVQQTVFDADKILPILKQDNEEFRQMSIMSGQSLAMRRVGAHHSSEGVFREYVGGYESGVYEKNLENNYDELKAEFINDCEMYQEILFSPSRLTVSVTGEHEDIVTNLIGNLNRVDANRGVVHYPFLKDQKEMLYIPSGIAYSAIGSNFNLHDFTYEPGLAVMSHLLTYDYLWNNVRVKGGAYGTGFSVNPNGNCGAYSYRDPSPLNSVSVFRKIGSFLRELDAETDVDQLIIGTLAGIDPLLSPAALIRVCDARYFRGIQYENRVKAQKIILEMTAEKLKGYADLLEKAMNEGAVCIVGAKELLGDAGEEYKELPQI